MKFHLLFSLLTAAGAAAQLLPAPQGPYHVTWENSELVDKSRIDPFNSTHSRRMMISRFTPVPRDRCQEICHLPYMTPEMSGLEDEIFIAAMASSGIDWPLGVFANLEVEVCCKHKKPASRKRFPTILFGTGYNTTRKFFTGVAQQIASMGYDVVVMDHPYETDVVEFPNGDVILGGKVGRQDLDDLVFGLDVRTRDVSFVLDTFNIKSTVYIGQSYGGASAAVALLSESRLVSGVNLDGSFWGNEQYSGVGRPFLCFGSTDHNSSSTEEPSWGNFFHAMETKHPNVWSKELSIKNSAHSSYYDFTLIGDITGLKKDPELAPLFGEASGVRVVKILREYLDDFIQFTLFGRGEGLLAGENPNFPDVDFIRQ